MKTNSVLALVVGVAVVSVVIGYVCHPATRENIIQTCLTNTVEKWQTNTVDRWTTNIVEVPAEIPEGYKAASNFQAAFLKSELLLGNEKLKGIRKLRFKLDCNETIAAVADTNTLTTKCELMLRQSRVHLVTSSADATLTVAMRGMTNDFGQVIYTIRVEVDDSTFALRNSQFIDYMSTIWHTEAYGYTGTRNREDTLIKAMTSALEDFLNNYLEVNPD